MTVLAVLGFLVAAAGFVWLMARALRPESHGDLLARDRDVERGPEPVPRPRGRHRAS